MRLGGMEVQTQAAQLQNLNPDRQLGMWVFSTSLLDSPLYF